MSDEHAIFVWWGSGATDSESQIWRKFKEVIPASMRVEVDFLEVYSEEEFQHLHAHLVSDGWIAGHNGSGGLIRVYSYRK